MELEGTEGGGMECLMILAFPPRIWVFLGDGVVGGRLSGEEELGPRDLEALMMLLSRRFVVVGGGV